MKLALPKGLLTFTLVRQELRSQEGGTPSQVLPLLGTKGKRPRLPRLRTTESLVESNVLTMVTTKINQYIMVSF